MGMKQNKIKQLRLSPGVFRRGIILSILFFISLITAIQLYAESKVSAELNAYHIAGYDIDNTIWSSTMLGNASVDVEASGYRNAKGLIRLQATAGDIAYVDLSRAYIKLRFPWFRVTTGKAPIAWGEGFAYNAADVLFRNFEPSANITSTEIRDNAAWITQIFYPTGPFSFIEAVYLPKPYPFSTALSGMLSGFSSETTSETESTTTENTGTDGNTEMETAPQLPAFDSGRFGARWYVTLWDIKWEGGYLWEGDTSFHNPYLSLQGHLLINWYLNASARIPHEEWYTDTALDSVRLSAGIYHMMNLAGKTLNLRIETLITPKAEWEETENNTDQYGILLYPELSLSVNDMTTVFTRSFVSPIELSGLSMAGIEWSPIQGNTLFLYATGRYGEEGDTYATGVTSGTANDIGITGGFRFSY